LFKNYKEIQISQVNSWKEIMKILKEDSFGFVSKGQKSRLQ